MEFVKDVLIKEARGHDYVFIVDNLPKQLLFTQVLKTVFVPNHAVDFMPDRPKISAAYTLRDADAPDEPKNRRLTGETVDQLLEGIEKSPTGDGGYVFHVENINSRQRLLEIDAYIKKCHAIGAVIPTRVPYAAVKGSMSSGPKPLSDLPRVELPGPVSPPTKVVQAPVSPEAVFSGLEPRPKKDPFPMAPTFAPDVPKPPRKYSEEQLDVMRANLAKAREKKAHTPTPPEVKP
jgi:hypothetical protein